MENLCSRCGLSLAEGAAFCPTCGWQKRQQPSADAATQELRDRIPESIKRAAEGDDGKARRRRDPVEVALGSIVLVFAGAFGSVAFRYLLGNRRGWSTAYGIGAFVFLCICFAALCAVLFVATRQAREADAEAWQDVQQTIADAAQGAVTRITGASIGEESTSVDSAEVKQHESVPTRSVWTNMLLPVCMVLIYAAISLVFPNWVRSDGWFSGGFSNNPARLLGGACAFALAILGLHMERRLRGGQPTIWLTSRTALALLVSVLLAIMFIHRHGLPRFLS